MDLPYEEHYPGETFSRLMDNLFTGQRQLLPAEPNIRIGLDQALNFCEKHQLWDYHAELLIMSRIFGEYECNTLTLQKAMNMYDNDHQLGLHFYAQSEAHVRGCKFYLQRFEDRFSFSYVPVTYHTPLSVMVHHSIEICQTVSVNPVHICTSSQETVHFETVEEFETFAKVIESEIPLVATRPVATCATAVAMSVIAMTPVLSTAVGRTLTVHPDMFCSVATCATAVAMSVIAMTPKLTTAVDPTLNLHTDMFCSADSNHSASTDKLTPMLNVNHATAYTIDCSVSETLDIRPCVTTLASCTALYPLISEQPLLMLRSIRNIHYCIYILSTHFGSYLPWHYKWLWFDSDHSSKPLRFSHSTVEGGGYSGYSMLRC